MKRMVKNGDLIDVEPDGSITVAGKPIGGGGGGSDYTAGSNIQISEAKEISLKNALTGIDNITFTPNNGAMISGKDGEIHLKSSGSYFDYGPISIDKKDDSGKSIRLTFSSNFSGVQNIKFTADSFNGKYAYCMLTRGNEVPQVPTTEGTYVLKATVQGSSVTYKWELQQ